MASGGRPTLAQALGYKGARSSAAPAETVSGVGQLPSLKSVLGQAGETKLPTLKDVLSGAATPAPAPKKSGGSFLGNLAHDAESYLSNAPTGALDLVKVPAKEAAATYDLATGNIKGARKQAQSAHAQSEQIVHGIGSNYAKTYGPLAHGDVGKFWHEFHQHPLGPLLDVATILTGGAGAVAKTGGALAKAGLVADDSRLAQLGRVDHLTAPDFAKRAGQDGEDVVLKQTSANPVVRARQRFVNRQLNRLPENTPALGSAARIVKALGQTPAREAARIRVRAVAFNRAFDKLSTSEKAAWHLKARAVHPTDYATHLEQQGENVSNATLNILRDPKVQTLFEHPSKALTDALTKGRALSDDLTAWKVKAGHVSEQAAAESPYRLLRLVNGAEVVRPTDALLGKPSQALLKARSRVERLQTLYDRADAKVGETRLTPQQRAVVRQAETPAGVDPNELFNQPGHHEVSPTGKVITNGRILSPAATGLRERVGAALSVAKDELQRLETLHAQKIGPTGWIDAPGREIAALAKDLAAKGHEQPFYVPDSAETSKAGAGTFARKPTGLNEPAVSGSSKQNLGVLANRGLLAMNQNPLASEVAKFANWTHGALLHDELVKHAAALPHGEPLPADYEYLKLNRGETGAPYTEKVASEFEHALDPKFVDTALTRDAESPDIATHPVTGERLVVPAHVRKILERQTLTHRGALHHLLYNQPTSVWKHLVLGLRPAFFGNITVGNSILGALQMAPGRHGFAGWINQVVPGASKVLGPKLTRATMEEVLPEQIAGTFGRSTGFSTGDRLNSARSVASKAYQGVMPATIAYEDVLRRAMAEGWANATPAVRAQMARNGGDINAALRVVAKTHPQVINDISKRIDDALGNYRTYNSLERNVKQLVPFYGWDRHIIKSTARLASERPGRLNAITKVGQLGQQKNDATLGALPTFLQGSISLGHLPAAMGPVAPGRTPLLTTHSLNPFNSTADLLRLGEGLVSGQAGTHSEELASGLNPFVQAAIEQLTGRSLLTGAPVHGPSHGLLGNVAYNTATTIPQATLAAAILGHGPKTKPGALYQKDWQSALAAFLGAPIKKTNLNTAHQMQAKEGKPRGY